MENVGPAAQTDQSGTEIFREECVEDWIETAVGVCETVSGQSYRDERVRDHGLVAGAVEVLNDEDDVDRQPAGAERRHHHDDEPRHSASSPRRPRRPADVQGQVPAPPAATHVVSAQKPENHACVQNTDEGHRENEREGEERSVEDSAVMRIVGQQTNVEARRTYIRVIFYRITKNLYHISTLLLFRQIF